MTLHGMQPGVRYIVTKASPGTLEVGDSIWCLADMALLSCRTGGWIDMEDWQGLDAEVELDRAHLAKQVQRMKAEYDKLTHLLETPNV